MRHFTLKGKSIVLWALGAPVVREKEKELILCCIWHEMIKRELRLSMNKSNPVPQDPISAIHPPCIYAGDVASAMGFGLCRSKMMNGIVALHSPPMQKDAAEKNGSELLTKHVGAKCYPALLLCSKRSPLMLLRRCFFAFSSLCTGALVNTGRAQAKCVVRNGKKDITTSPLCWTAGANTVVSDQD
ncbi:hypothetical protein WN944_019000 [Citrus x changshan-huyou]|uniref:Uncharacterized protein n=1 Tax=Citrus x changshan-huyou TaxID=2935761 RepID=A0AAP0LXC2_9ROSI